ncbi:MAG TPA: hypothetical protein VIH14_00845 [Anaerolineales bacterium]
MKRPFGFKHILQLALSLVVALVLSACASLVSPQPPVVLEATSSPVATATSPAPLVLLVAPPQADPEMSTAAAEVATTYASGQQMRFEQREMLDPAQLPAELAVLLLLAPDPGAAALAAAAPQARVITIGYTPEAQASNLVALPLSEGADGSIAFIAGYIAALAAEDWRAGMLYTSASASWVDDFVAGAEYFCGACIPIAPPQADLPLAVQAPDAQNWQAAADQLLASQIRVVYLAPELEAGGAGQYLAGFGVLLIGTGAQPQELAPNWLVSVTADALPALRQQLPLALSGQPFDPAGTLGLVDINASLLSEARVTHIQTVITDLLLGYIQLPPTE